MGALETYRSLGHARQPQYIRSSLPEAPGYNALFHAYFLGSPRRSRQANSVVDIPTMHQSKWHVSNVKAKSFPELRLTSALRLTI